LKLLQNKIKKDLNKNSLGAHVESEFDVFGIAKNSLKYVVHMSKIGIFLKRILLLQGAQTENN
jgi:hypothetical protein